MFCIRRFVHICPAIILVALSLTSCRTEENYSLRGYRGFTHSVETKGNDHKAVVIHRFKFEDAGRASVFVSKIFSDYELTSGNRLEPWTTRQGIADAISLAGEGYIVPVMEKDSRVVHILTGADKQKLLEEIQKCVSSKTMRRTELSHPLYMDKWERYCFGAWQRISDIQADPDYKTPDAFYGWMGKAGINSQIVDAAFCYEGAVNDNLLTWLRSYYRKYGVKFQVVDWLQTNDDLYNRNPFLSSFPGGGVTPDWSYYGEVPHAPGPLKDVQNADAIKLLKGYADDERLMAVLDPDGEVGFQAVTGVWNEYGPVQRRNFVRYLRDYRKFSLSGVSERYIGKKDAFKSWDDVTLPDWRIFYGWADGAVDLAGEWRVMRDDRGEGLRQSWQSPAYDDSDWISLHYPGDMTLKTLFTGGAKVPVWMRKTIKLAPAAMPHPLYLSIAPLCEKPVQVFVNGRRMGSIEPHVWTLRTYGQFDVTDVVTADGELTVALRMSGAGSAPFGPIFLTSRKMQDFPTDDPCVNARRFDHFDFIDWAAADAVRMTILNLRSVDADRPVKVHAYEHSPHAWKVIKEMGGFSHHTGSGAGWSWTEPKQYGSSRNLQDSSETGGSMDTPRDIKGLMGNLIFMGKNAHDYFHDIQSITNHPGMRKWLEERLPAIRIMGRANVHTSTIASIRGLQNMRCFGEFSREEGWRHGYDFARGGELTTLLDELRVKEGGLPYRAIFDEGNLCWDDEMVKALENYVVDGGILFLQAGSGRHSDIIKDMRPGAKLAGVAISGERGEDVITVVAEDDPLLGGVKGKSEKTITHAMTKCLSIKPLEGSAIVGTFQDGTPAVTRRALGKGKVYYCAAGVWPGFILAAVNERLGTTIYAKVEGGGVDQVRTLRSNNGAEELLMLRGLGKEATVRWTLDFVPGRIYDPVTGTEVKTSIEGTSATFTVNIPDWDFAWFAARRPDADEQFTHWLKRQSEIWDGLVKGEPPPEVPLFRHLDLNREWMLVQTDSPAEAARLSALTDTEAGIKPCPLILWNTPGLKLKAEKGVGLYRRYFDLPGFWKEGDIYHLRIDGRIWGTTWHGFQGPGRILVNGAEVWKGDKIDVASIDISQHVKKTGNKLEIIHEGNGIMAFISLVRTVKPDAVIDLAGEWKAVDGTQAIRSFILPGKTETAFIYREIEIPRDQEPKEVWISVDTGTDRNAASSSFLIINGRKRYETLGSRDEARPLELNITPDVRFGEANRIIIGNNGMVNGWTKGLHEYRKAELRFYEPGRWSPDGKGIRTALTPKEMESALRPQRAVVLYPMAHPPIVKIQVPLAKITDDEAASFQPPEPVLALKLDGDGARISDTSSNKIPVTVNGACEAFTERDGKVRGIYLRENGNNSGWLEIPNAPLQKLLIGKPFTICAWVKPIQKERDVGTFMRWGHSLVWEIGLDSTSFTINYQWSNQLNAECVIALRTWQFLSLAMDGNKARMWVDGVDVGTKEWDAPLANWHTPVFIGSTFGKTDFLNFKLASFAIYPGALPEKDVIRMFMKDRSRFAVKPQEAWPEDDLLSLRMKNGAIDDGSEIPGEMEKGPGVKASMEDGREVIRFDGSDSFILFKEHPKVHILGAPFSMIMDIKPDEGSVGCVFRRYHDLCLNLEKDGSLRFDANIGQNKTIVFPKVVTHGQWNRLMFTYDGKTASLHKDGKLVENKEYPGHLSRDRRLPLCFGADNTWPRKDGKIAWQIPMSLREFRIVPKILEAMPQNGDSR
ncbi:MAG: LamG-like jellyroll fold domain-containing protein [Victivallales bacterium]